MSKTPMPNSKGAVLFTNDRTIFYFEYDAGSQVALNKLYESEREVEKNWNSFRSGICRCPRRRVQFTSVEIMTLHGGGIHWRGYACNRCRYLIKGTDPNSRGTSTHTGVPEWSPWQPDQRQ